MSVKLNGKGFAHARGLVDEGKVVIDERDAWSEHQPSTQDENAYIEEHGIAEYSRWFLGIDTSQPESSKRRYKFPYSDFQRVHRCAVVTAESRAGQYKHFDVERAAHELHEMIDQRQRPARAAARRAAPGRTARQAAARPARRRTGPGLRASGTAKGTSAR